MSLLLQVWGGTGVGKTSLARRLTEDVERSSGQVVIDDEITPWELQEMFLPCTAEALEAHGFLMVYSVDNRESFEAAVDMLNQLQDLNGEALAELPFVLVANKRDLDGQRQVTKKEGVVLAEKTACPFFETSATLGTNVEDAFLSLVREARYCVAFKQKETSVAPSLCCVL